MKNQTVFIFFIAVMAAAACSGFRSGANGEESASAQKIAFYSGRYGNREICLINPDGTDFQRLTNNTAHDECPSFSPDGKKIAFISDRDGNYEIYLMNPDGSDQQRITHTPEDELHTDWTPDGTKIAFSRYTDQSHANIFVMDADGSNVQQITHHDGENMRPDWSPDGAQILFNTNKDGNYEIYLMNADGTNQQRLTNTAAFEVFPQLSPDGNRIVYARIVPSPFYGEIHIRNLDGSGDVALTQNSRSENPVWSPGGEQIAFQSSRSGNFEVYTMNADGSDQQRLTNHSSWDGWPSWGVVPAVPVHIVEKPLTSGNQGCPYADTLEVVSGTGTSPFEWGLTSGSLPAGLTLGEASGIISGTPAETGMFSFSAQVTDAREASDTLSFTLTINPHEETKADANADCTINVLDVLTVVNIILDLKVPDQEERWRTDCSGTACEGDGTINVLDALTIVNVILGTAQCP